MAKGMTRALKKSREWLESLAVDTYLAEEAMKRPIPVIPPAIQKITVALNGELSITGAASGQSFASLKFADLPANYILIPASVAIILLKDKGSPSAYNTYGGNCAIGTANVPATGLSGTKANVVPSTQVRKNNDPAQCAYGNPVFLNNKTNYMALYLNFAIDAGQIAAGVTKTLSVTGSVTFLRAEL